MFARVSDDPWQPVDLHEELEASLRLLNHLLKDRITVERAFQLADSVECVRSQIDQVFLNLLANAAQAIPGPGVIEIETRRDGPMAVVTIRDTGPGIAPDVLGRIFDPFFTTKSVGRRHRARALHQLRDRQEARGELRAESAPGGGAAFTVRLPVTAAAAKPAVTVARPTRHGA